MLVASAYEFIRICGVSHEDIVTDIYKDEGAERSYKTVVSEVLEWLEDRGCQSSQSSSNGYHNVVFPSQDIAMLFRLTFYR